MLEPELYDVLEGETAMTHRAFRIDGMLVQVFDSKAGAEKYIAQHAKDDYSVLVRGRMFFMRRGDVEVTINLKADSKHERGHLIAAAQTIASEIETLIVRERLAA